MVRRLLLFLKFRNEVETADGSQIITVGLVPEKLEFFPREKFNDVVSALPEDYKVRRSLGVVSYYFDKSQIK